MSTVDGYLNYWILDIFSHTLILVFPAGFMSLSNYLGLNISGCMHGELQHHNMLLDKCNVFPDVGIFSKFSKYTFMI